MVKPLFSLGRPRIAPPSAQPFPRSGKWYLLVLCPVCKLKGLPLFYAPSDPIYNTRCLKCGQRHRVSPKGVPVGEVREKLGGHHFNSLVRREVHHDGRVYFDASRFLEDRLEFHADPKGYVRRGAQVTREFL